MDQTIGLPGKDNDFQLFSVYILPLERGTKFTVLIIRFQRHRSWLELWLALRLGIIIYYKTQSVKKVT